MSCAIRAGRGQPLVHEFYQVLGVRTEAADEEIKTAFRRLAKQLHPDLHPGDADTQRRFQAVIRAYETLSDRQSRMAYDAGLKNQRLLRRWQFRANAMTLVAAFSLTVSVGLHWEVLSQAIQPASDRTARLASNESHPATSGKAEGASSPLQGASPHVTEEREDPAVPNKKPELHAELTSALQDHSSVTVVNGSSAKVATAEATSSRSPALADLALAPDPTNETTALPPSLPNKMPELNAERSSALWNHASATELVDGSSAKVATTEATSSQFPALANLEPALYATSETIALQPSLPEGSAMAQSGSGAGWWIILGSFDVGQGESAATLIASGVRQASGAAQRCGMGAFNDFSAKFRGFAPGYVVVVIGPFSDKAEAARSRQRVNGCVSGTYVKYAQHLAE